MELQLYPGIPGILPSCPIPTHLHSLSDIPSIPGYLGSSPVVLYLLTNTHCRTSQVSRDTWDPPQLSYTYSPTLTVGHPKYPGILGILPSCPIPTHQYSLSDIPSIPGIPGILPSCPGIPGILPSCPGIPGILPSCPIPTHQHSLSDIPSIPGYLGSSPVVLYLLTNTHCRTSQVSRDTWDPPQLSYTYSPTLTVGYPKYPGDTWDPPQLSRDTWDPPQLSYTYSPTLTVGYPKYPGILGILPRCPIPTHQHSLSDIPSILGYLGSSPVVLYLLTNTHCRTSQVSWDTWDPPQLSYTYSPTLTVGYPKYPGILGILPSCPIPTHQHSLSDIPSIPGYLGSSPVVLYLLTYTHCRISQVSRDTWDPPQLSYTYSPTLTVGYPKYPGIPGILPSCPIPTHLHSLSDIPSIPGYLGSSPVVLYLLTNTHCRTSQVSRDTWDPPQLSYTYSPTLTVGYSKYPGIPGILPSCPIPTHLHSLSDIPSIPGYLGSSPVVLNILGILIVLLAFMCTNCSALTVKYHKIVSFNAVDTLDIWSQMFSTHHHEKICVNYVQIVSNFLRL